MERYLDTPTNIDCLAGLRLLPDNCIDCCVTSPPYYGLRDYGTEGQIGLEESPEEYIEKLTTVFTEVLRVLKPSGSLWLNIADSYAGSGKGASRYPDNAKGYLQGTNAGTVGNKTWYKYKTNCKDKDLIGIPWLLAFSLRGVGYYLRQEIIWYKPNAMPESVKDRCTKSHESIFLLTKSKRYYFDSEAIREAARYDAAERRENAPRYGGKKYTESPDIFYRTKSGNAYAYTGFRNRRDVWAIPTRPEKSAHFATFPPDLITPCILAGSPRGGSFRSVFRKRYNWAGCATE